MGTGKTSLAPELAKHLQFSHIEMDELILARSNRSSINEIFELDGEAHFRNLELEVARSLETTEQAVISTGGGVVMNPMLMEQLKNQSVTIGLNAEFSTIQKRLESDDSRPLLKDAQKAETLYRQRAPLYQQYADISIATDQKSASEVLKEATVALQSFCKKG